MTKYDLTNAGLPGIEYEFVEGGSIHIFRKGDIEHNFEKPPWKAKEEEMGKVANLLDEKLSSVRKAILILAEAYSKADKKKIGKPEGEEQEWSRAGEVGKNSESIKLDCAVIADLLKDKYVVVDNMLMEEHNGAYKIVTKESLSKAIITSLRKAGISKGYATNTQTLVRDHLLSCAATKTLGATRGFLPMQNGVLDIAKGQLVDSEDVYLATTDIAFDPEATKMPKIQRMLDNMFTKEQQELVLSVIGAALSGRKAPFILAMSGIGRNGKSQFRELIEALASRMITTELAENINKDFVNDIFLGKRIVWQTEVNSKRSFTDKLKDISGGTTIQVRQKFVNGCLQVPLSAVVILDTNNPPHLENSKAIEERLRYVSMPHVFVQKLTGAPNEILIDPKLIEGWEDELPALLNVLLPYMQYFLENGKLMKDVAGTAVAYQAASNVVSEFIDHYCEVVSDEERELTMYTFMKYLSIYAAKKNTGIPEKDQIRYKLKHEYDLRLRASYILGLRLKVQMLIDDFPDDAKFLR